MTTLVSTAVEDTVRQPGNFTLLLRYLNRNRGLAVGLFILLGLVLFTVIGLLTVNPKHAYPLAVATKQPPSLKYPFGTDFFGRNMLEASGVTADKIKA